MKKKISFIVATFFGAGYFPKASGTFGSLATLPFVFFINQYFGLSGMLAFITTTFVFGTIATKEVLKHTTHDPKEIVIDETVGQSIALLYLAINPSVWTYVFGFALFRVFDILKPYPVSYFDKQVENEYGVMLDDVVAGIFAFVVLYICGHLF
ncbi:MAG: phosphatidylglycerophosphatase A [Alphaproteobacteria bacterium]